MTFEYSSKTEDLRRRVNAFMEEHIVAQEGRYWRDVETNRRTGREWEPSIVVQELIPKARAAGLWNLFLPESAHGAGLTNLEYAPLAELMGRVSWSSEVFNCSPPDTGNMETLERYGTAAQKDKWLAPLLDARIRSAFLMTEPAVASSDATNIQTRIRREGEEYVISGRKWWASGAGDPRCEILIVMGKTDPEAPRHSQQSMVLVPMRTAGVGIVRPCMMFGWDDAPHGHMEMTLDEVRVPVSNILLGEGRGFEIAQGRLGPGRIHHCMRLVGVAERALELMCERLQSRVAFGGEIARQGVWHERIAQARCLIDQARLLTLKAAHMMDTVGNKVAKAEIAMIKVVAPRMACKVLDWAIQAHGAAGFTEDTPLAKFFRDARILRVADGPDEVHCNAIAKLELGRAHMRRTAAAARAFYAPRDGVVMAQMLEED